MDSLHEQPNGNGRTEEDVHQDGECSTSRKRQKINHEVENHRGSTSFIPVEEYDVVLLTNCYRIRSEKSNPFETLYTYKLNLSLVNLSCQNYHVLKSLSGYLETMEKGNIPQNLRKRIVDTAIEKWTHQYGLEGLFMKCDENYSVVLTNFYLPSKKYAISKEVVEAPFRIGNQDQPNLEFLIHLERIRKDFKQLLSSVLSANERPAPNPFVRQTDISLVKYDVADQIDMSFLDGARELRGLSIQAESMALKPTFSVTDDTKMFFTPLNGTQNLVDFLLSNHKTCNLGEPLEESTFLDLCEDLTSRQVEVTHLRIFDLPLPSTICAVSTDTAHQPSQLVPRQSIYEYLRTVGIQLKFPNLPCVELKFNGDKHLIPMELCHLIEAQETHLMYDDREERDEVKRKAMLRPLDYFERVERHVQQVISLNETNLRKVNVKINQERDRVKVVGQVLAPIDLRGGDNRTVRPCTGKYITEHLKFLDPIKLQKFCVTWVSDTIDTSDEFSRLRDGCLCKFYQEYCRVGRSKGVKIDISDFLCKTIMDGDKESLYKALEKHVDRMNMSQIEHAVVILPDQSEDLHTHLYALEAKFRFDYDDSTSGRRTRLSCIRLDDLKKILAESEEGNDEPLQAQWMIYNAQLGGISYVPAMSNLLDSPDEGLMILSVHRKSLSTKSTENWRNTILAMVALWSAPAGGYSHRVQFRATSSNYDEQTNDFEKLGGKVLDSYSKRMGKKLPSKLLILREGEMEETWTFIESKQVNEVRKCWDLKYDKIGQARPKVSLAVIQRHHNIRFKLSSPIKVEGDADCQMPPGTVVESSLFGIDAFAYSPPNRLDPDRIKVPIVVRKLMNEIPMTDRDFQRLIISLCHLTPVPIPIYLAKLAVERGEDICFLEAENYSSNIANRLDEFLSELGDDYLNTMFYVSIVKSVRVDEPL